MDKNWLKLQLAIGVVLLAGCGGSDDPQASAPDGGPAEEAACLQPPEGPLTALPHGIYGGTVQGLPATSFVLVARPSPSSPGYDEGLVFVGPDLAAQSTLSAVSYLSTFGGCDEGRRTYNTRMLGLRAYAQVTLDPAAPSLQGTIRLLDSANTSYPLTGGPIAGSSFDPKARPQISDFAGRWMLTGPRRTDEADLSFAPDGNFTGRYRGCQFSGTAIADSKLNLISLPARFDAVQPAGCSVRQSVAFDVDGFALLIPGGSGGAQLIVRILWTDGWDHFELAAIGRR